MIFFLCVTVESLESDGQYTALKMLITLKALLLLNHWGVCKSACDDLIYF